jgi:hypothetical protein
MFWTALVKPLNGVLLAIFVQAALVGGVVNFGALLDGDAFAGYGTDEGLARQTIHVLLVIGFLAGFSERFAWASSTARRAAPPATSLRPGRRADRFLPQHRQGSTVANLPDPQLSLTCWNS